MSDSEYQELLRLREERAATLAENQQLKSLIEQLSKTNEELRELLKDLQAKLDVLIVQQKKRNRRDYGKKTEKYNPRPAVVEAHNDTTRKPGNNEARIEQIRGLPPEDVFHRVADEDRSCPDCQVEKIELGQDVSYQLERLAGTIKRLRHVQEILVCPKCRSKISVASKPEPPFPKATVASGLLSHVIVSKYADFSTLYRLERIYAREGAPIPRSTLADWILAASLTLEPLYNLLVAQVFNSKVVCTDDTEVKIQDRRINKNIRKGKMSVYVGDRHFPYSIFDFSPNQSFERNKAMFATFKGFVQADAAPGFDAIFEDGARIEVGCNAHARRKYFECQVVAEQKVKPVLDLYRDIYKIEEAAKRRGAPASELLHLRQTKSKPLFDSLQKTILKLQETELPKSPLSKAVNYSLEHWQALTRFLDDPDLEIDNNISERTVKDFVLCRKNALFVGSDAGGKAAAICLSLLVSAKRNGVEPWSYLKDIFTCINGVTTNQLQQFLPDVWLMSQNKPQ